MGVRVLRAPLQAASSELDLPALIGTIRWECLDLSLQQGNDLNSDVSSKNWHEQFRNREQG